MLGFLVSTLVGAVLSWAVGRTLDVGVAAATDSGPLAVEVGTWDEGDDVLPMALSSVDLQALESAYGAGNLRAFVLANGGVSTGLQIQLLAYGVDDVPIVIRAIDAIDVECDQPTSPWTLVTHDKGGDLPDLPVTMKLRMNADVAPGDPSPQWLSSGGRRPWSFPRQVSNAEADEFLITPRPPRGAICAFRIKVDYSGGGEELERIIDESGMPFRVADARVGQDTYSIKQ